MKHLGLIVAAVAWVACAAAQPATPPTQAIAADPNNAAVLEQLADLSFRELVSEARRLIDAEQYEAAKPYVAAAAQKDRKSLDVSLLLGDLALAENDVRTARPLYLSVYRVDRNDFRANLGLGKLYLRTRVWRQAANYLEKAEQTAPLGKVPEVQQLLAEAYRGGGQVLKAVEVAQKAVSGAPQDYDARRSLTSALLAAERTEQALGEAEMFVKIARDQVVSAPDSPAALADLRTARELQLQALRRAFRDMLQVGPSGQRVDEVTPGREAEAAGVLKQISEVMVMQAETNRLLAYHDVLSFAERIVELDDDNADYWRDYGLMLLETRRMDEAREALRRAVELNPDDQAARAQLERLGAGAPGAAAGGAQAEQAAPSGDDS